MNRQRSNVSPTLETLGQPTWFGRYRLTSRIATGGMAEVYAGRQITESGEFGPMVAVKRLLPHLVKDSSVVRMFLNEAHITQQIDHPNVVRIIDLGNEGGEPYIAMELLEGHTFAEVRERVADDGKRVPIGVTLYVLTHACLGLDAAHRAADEEGRPLRLVHRDFTPDNIHVSFQGIVKVIDFGVAKTAMLGAGTEPGTLKGKFFYMSPEMVLAQPVDHRADVFAAGVMLYEQLCGRRPFTGHSIDEVVMRIAQGDLKPPRQIDPAVPPELEDVCLKALSHNPELRFQSLGELIDAIAVIGGDAKLSDATGVATYLRQVFPHDQKRDTLRRAREIDPSHPGHPLAGAESKVDTAAAPAEPSAAPHRAAATPTHSAEPPSRILRWVTAVLSVLAGAALGGYFLMSVPKSSPDQLLQAARSVTDEKSRGDLLESFPVQSATAQQSTQAGQLLIASGAYAAALKLAEAWQRSDPNQAEAWLLEARAALKLRKGKRVEQAAERAKTLTPNNPEPFVLLAELKEQLGEAHAAMEAWQAASAVKPQELQFKARVGYWQSQLNQLDLAQTTLSELLQKRFDGASASELGFVKFRKGDAAGAARLLKEVIRKEPDLMSAHYYLGAVHYQLRDAKSAKTEYLLADRLAPQDPRPLTALCQMQSQMNSSDLGETKKLIETRFPDGKAIAASCDTTP